MTLTEAAPAAEPAPEVPYEVPPRFFGRASEEPYRRRVIDGAKLVAAAVVFVLLLPGARTVGPFQQSVFDAVDQLPGGLRPVARLLYGLPGLWAIGLVGAAALLGRRRRLARDLLLAGVAAWLLARGCGLAVGSSGLRHHLAQLVRVRSTPPFPSVHVALVSAVSATAAPYVTRATRRFGVLLVLLIIPGALYLGRGFPSGLIAGAMLGIMVAAAVHLLFGSPGGRPTPAQVSAGLSALGVHVTELALAPVQPAGSTLMEASDTVGPLRVKVLGRDETDARLLSKLGRWLYLRDAGPTLHLTRAQEVEHEAYVLLLAAGRGARVPQVIAAGTGGPGVALLAERTVGGLALADLPELSDRILDQSWEQLMLLHAGNIEHGHLNTGSLLLAPAGVTVVDFGAAVTAASESRRAFDVAELLASTARQVGVTRAVAAAVRALPERELRAALPLLQPAALTRQGRRLAGDGKANLTERLDELRRATAEAIGSPDPELAKIERIKPATLALTAGGIVGVSALLFDVGQPKVLIDTFSEASVPLMLTGVAWALAVFIGYAVAMAGSVPIRLPLRSNLLCQLAGAFSNLALPIGSQAVQVRYLQRQGMEVTSAVAATGLVNVIGGGAVQLLLFVLATALSPKKVTLAAVPTGTVVLVLGVLMLALLVISIITRVVRPLRKRYWAHMAAGGRTLLEVLRSPRELGLLVLGNVISAVALALSLQACMSAVQTSLSVWALLAITIGISTIAALVPVPGGGSALASVGMSGALTALGVPSGPAVAAVLLHRIVNDWVPAALGWFATRALIRSEDL